MFQNIHLFGVAAVISSVALLIHSLQPANATSGPNVSLGSNPIQHYYQSCDNQTNAVIFTNSSTSDFVITDIYNYYGTVVLHIDGNVATLIHHHPSSNSGQAHIPFVSGLRVPSGSTLTCTDDGDAPRITISGYYAHP